MSTPAEKRFATFATVLRSADPVGVEAACSLLEAEGIPTQHVGKKHAALIPGSTFIIVEVRVPEEHKARARALLEEAGHSNKTSPEDTITFRMQRDYGLLYALIGAGIGGAAAMVMYWMRMEVSYLVLIISQLFFIGVGFLQGKKLVVLHCSRPTCTAALREHDESCPGCGARICGTVHSALQHMAAVEAIVSRRSEPPPPPSEPEPAQATSHTTSTASS